MNRKPKFAGSWYPDNINQLKKFIEKPNTKTKIETIGCICPHAGWMYSGKIAASVYSIIKPADVYILLGPNHTGYGENIAIYPEGHWETPLGKVKIDEDLVELIMKNSEFAKKDIVAHQNEHSLEIQIPFLQLIAETEPKIVPIAIKVEDYEMCKDLGNAISTAVKTYIDKNKEKKIIIVASTDMTHYEPQSYAYKLDTLAVEQILKLSPKGLYDTVLSYGITMCGVYPTVSSLIAEKLLGAKNAKLIKYQTSGDITGDYSSVVGYAGIIIY
ncbi:MAG: AmmeMemoRadiSam system protein B [Endomicrobia bacterium]|nr:AmmeMemoRadiSam system protein B [Endomicrobiia bacterium]